MPAKEVFKEFRAGRLHSGSKHGKVVTKKKQAKKSGKRVYKR